MSNPLFNQLGGNASPIGGIMQAFNRFKNSFNGDPQQQIQQLLNSGKVSQAQYNKAVQLANQLAPMMGIKK